MKIYIKDYDGDAFASSRMSRRFETRRCRCRRRHLDVICVCWPGADGSITSTQCDANWLDSVCRAGPVNRPADCLQSRGRQYRAMVLLTSLSYYMTLRLPEQQQRQPITYDAGSLQAFDSR